MGFSYRKRVRLAPGININLSTKGASVTVGPRGASVNVGKSGIYQNVGIPGTGLYSRKKISGKGSITKSQSDNTRYTQRTISNKKIATGNSSTYLPTLYVFAVLLVIGIVICFIYKNF